jgi:hypothetical protein
MSKGPGRVTRGDGIFGLLGAPVTALWMKRRRESETSRPSPGVAECRTRTTRVLRVAASRQWSQAMTGEALRRPMVGQPNP